MIWAALIFGTCLVTAALIYAYANKPRALEQRGRKQVVVTAKSGTTYRGVLWESDAHMIVLRSAQLLTDGVVPVDGELLVHRADVETIQIP